MRVLVVSSPGIGHIFPLVPMACALRAAGHDVLVASADEIDAAVSSGLRVLDVAPGLRLRELRERIFAADPDLRYRALTQQNRTLDVAAELFARVNRPLVGGVLRVADAWRPDLILHDQMSAAAVLAAARLGIPAVQQSFGFARTAGLREAMAGRLADVYEHYGVSGLPERVATLDVAPPSMLAGEPEGWSVRYVPYNGGGLLPDRLLDPPARRRVVITLGTVSPVLFGFARLRRILGEAADVDAEFVLALGSADPGDLGSLPPNVSAVPWTPLGAFFWHCSGVVHHAGSGTLLTALAAGVPQLLLPDGADRYINADAMRSRGAGLVSTADEVDGGLLERLITDEKLASVAHDVQAEAAAMPAPVDLVPRIAALAG